MSIESRPPALAEMQYWLREVFTGNSPEGPLREAIRDQPPLSRAERLAIYSRAWFWRLLDTLADDFEGTGRALTWVEGFAAFESLVREYLRRHPSRSRNITEVGRAFPGFIASHPLGDRHPWLPWLARVEWAVVEAFLAPDPRPLPPESLTLLSGPGGARVRLELGESVSLIRAPWPVLGLWRDRKRKLVDPPRSPRQQGLVVWRAFGGVAVEAVPRAALELLDRLRVGDGLALACETVGARWPLDPRRLSGWFGGWVKTGILTGLTA